MVSNNKNQLVLNAVSSLPVPSSKKPDTFMPSSYQSANTFFHFMDKERFLHEIIKEKKIYPRFCEEDISNLELDIRSISIAMKCFCDIPLHLVSEHKKEYGSYCIGLSKEWGIQSGLQPVIYYNSDSSYTRILKSSYNAAMKYAADDNLVDEVGGLVNHAFKYIKPVIGTDLKTKKLKDFTDEKEWRFVPDILGLDFSEIIVKKGIIKDKALIEEYNKSIRENKYCLSFDYDDIKYLFVNNDSQRRRLIKLINKLECSQIEKDRLITKICVWKEREGDF